MERAWSESDQRWLKENTETGYFLSPCQESYLPHLSWCISETKGSSFRRESLRTPAWGLAHGYTLRKCLLNSLVINRSGNLSTTQVCFSASSASPSPDLSK